MDHTIDTSRHNNFSRIYNNGNNRIIDLNTLGTNETHTQVVHLIDNSSHNKIFSHSNNMGNNKINTIITSGTIDNDTQLASCMDKGRHSNISSNF